VLVADAWQRRGAGTQLVSRLAQSAKRRGISQVQVDVLGESAFLLRTLRRLGTVESVLSRGTYSATVTIDNWRHAPPAA
jgi:GNAT superfamily N-acetyltransferase